MKTITISSLGELYLSLPILQNHWLFLPVYLGGTTIPDTFIVAFPNSCILLPHVISMVKAFWQTMMSKNTDGLSYFLSLPKSL